MTLPELSDVRLDARKLQQALNDFLFVADNRVRRPHIGATKFPVPYGSTWSWRPEVLTHPLQSNVLVAEEQSSNLEKKLQVFHDCSLGDIMVSQCRHSRVPDYAPFSLQVEVFDFNGTFLSLVFNLPREGITDMVREHILRVEILAEVECELSGFLRLNVQHGPNKEQMVQALELTGEDIVEFDFAYSKINMKRIRGAWLELIVNTPAMNMLKIYDIRLSRRLRAEI